MSKVNKRSLCNIQICAREKQNRLTRQEEYGMMFVLGGLLAARFLLPQPDPGNKKRTRYGCCKNGLKSEMTLDYCLFCHDKKHFL